MGIITSIRAPLPITEASRSEQEPRARPGATTPVARTAPDSAVQHPPAIAVAIKPRLLETRVATETSAAQAAEAAREAYIRASIAAGISPLPLP